MKQISKSWKDLLQFIYHRSWISIHDICFLFYPNLKYARRVMRTLIDFELIKHVQCSIMDGAKGPGLNFYSLTTNGYRQFGLEAYKFHETKNPTSTNLLHYYLINLFLTGFANISKEYDDITCQYITQRQIFEGNHFYNYFREQVPQQFHDQFALPDFVLCLSNNDVSNLYFGEVDTTSEAISSSSANIKTIERKFKSFALFKTHNIQSFFNDTFNQDFQNFIYLHITSGSESRLSTIANLCKKENLFGLDEILLTTAESILPNIQLNENGRLKASFDNMLSNVWIRPSSTDKERSSILL